MQLVSVWMHKCFLKINIVLALIWHILYFEEIVDGRRVEVKFKKTRLKKKSISALFQIFVNIKSGLATQRCHFRLEYFLYVFLRNRYVNLNNYISFLGIWTFFFVFIERSINSASEKTKSVRFGHRSILCRNDKVWARCQRLSFFCGNIYSRFET